MPTTTFSMRMDQDMRAALNKRAKLEERSVSHIAERAIQEWLNRQEAVSEAIREAIAIDDGWRISGEAIDQWMQRWADGHDDPFPEPDIFEDPAGLRKSV